MAVVTYSNEDMNRFWLNIMGDNALIILNNLSPLQKEEISQARALANRFDDLALRAIQSPTKDQTAQINRDAFQATQDFRKYVLHIAKEYLTKDFHLDLKPAVIDYFVDEAERYLTRLHIFMQNGKVTYDQILEEVFWLPIFTQQSYYIANNVGYYQKENREKALEMADILNDYSAFSMELRGLSRIGKDDFPIAVTHHRKVVDVLNDYYEFLTNLISQQKQLRIPGTMSLLYLDRSRRMVCLFLTQAAQFTDQTVPECVPYATRLSSI